MKIPLAILRFFQILFSAVVLGLSVTLAKAQFYDKVPPTTNYSAFAGAFGMLASLVGIGALFVSHLDGVVSWVFDGLAAIVTLAGGIAFAVGLKGTKCSDIYTLPLNNLLNCGLMRARDVTFIGCEKSLQDRCRKATADSVFLFLAFIISLAALGLSLFTRKSRSRGGYAV